MSKVKELWKKYKEIVMYLIFGVLTTVVSWVSYAGFVWLLGSLIENGTVLAAVANVISWVLAVAFAFVTNKLWVFESKSMKPLLLLKEAGAFVGSRLLTGCLEWFGVPLLMIIGLNQTLFGIEGMVAKVAVSVLVVIGNYVLGKLIVFRKKKDEKQGR